MQRSEGVPSAGARNTDGSRGVHGHRQEVSVVADGWDDEEFLAVLQQALGRRSEVPPEFVAAAKSAYTWRNTDVELAQLTCDSTCDYAPVRSEAASIRALTFTSPHLCIELEVMEDSLFGRVHPAQAASVEVHARTDPESAIPTDEVGCFVIHPIPRSPFRLRCRATASIDVLTSWLTLLHRLGPAPKQPAEFERALRVFFDR